MNASNTDGSNREPRLLEIGEPEEIGSGEDLGVPWTLSIRPMITEKATIPGLYIETDTGQGGGGGGSRGMNPAPDLRKVTMTDLDRGLVANYGPLVKWPMIQAVSVEFTEGQHDRDTCYWALRRMTCTSSLRLSTVGLCA